MNILSRLTAMKEYLIEHGLNKELTISIVDKDVLKISFDDSVLHYSYHSYEYNFRLIFRIYHNGLTRYDYLVFPDNEEGFQRMCTANVEPGMEVLDPESTIIIREIVEIYTDKLKNSLLNYER